MLQQDGRAVDGLHQTLAKFGGIGGGKNAADDVFVAVLIEDAAAGVAVHVAAGGKHLVSRYAVVPHLARVEQYLVFLYITAYDGDLRHSARR
ncbi:hypothetical protein Barb4_04820 [Bacteroidales bacterium Barb4]|nr:hypothetical protein Barb4_04820 [Bacteroidales bacterium Barb4]